MGEFKLGDQVTIDGVSLQGQIVSVSQYLHSSSQYLVRRYTTGNKRVSDWYYAEELNLRPTEENLG